MKKILIAVVFCFLSPCLKAQISDLRLGVGSGLTYYAGDISDKQFGLKVLGELSLAKELAISVGYLSNFANKVTPSSNKVDDGTKVDLDNISLNLLFYIKSKVNDDFSMYIPIGVSYVWGKQRAAYYVGNNSFLYQEDVKDFALNLGFGAHKRIGKPMLFSEVTVSIPINSEGARRNNNNSNPMPHTLSFNDLSFYGTLLLGIKIPIITEFKRKQY